MSLLDSARGEVAKRADEVKQAVGDTAARAMRRDAVLAAGELETDVRELAPSLTAFAAATLLGAHGWTLVSGGTTSLLSRVMPRWAAELVCRAGSLSLAAFVARIGWSRRPRELLGRTKASLRQDLG